MNEGKFEFWQKWLFVVSLVIIAFGVYMALFNGTVAFSIFNNQFDPVFWNMGEIPGAADKFQGWIYGVLGATVAGWGLMISFITHYPFQNKEKWAWNSLVTAMTLWYLLDTGISWYFSVNFNVLFNTILLISVGLPIIFTKKYF